MEKNGNEELVEIFTIPTINYHYFLNINKNYSWNKISSRPVGDLYRLFGDLRVKNGFNPLYEYEYLNFDVKDKERIEKLLENYKNSVKFNKKIKDIIND